MRAAPVLAVLFDMDGTLVDTERLWLEAAADILATTPDPASYAGATAERYLELLAADSGRPVDRAAFTAALADRYATNGVAWMPGAQQLLQRLTRAGTPLALVTSSDRPAVQAVLAQLGPQPFRVIVTADDVCNHKPHPEPYLLAANLLGVPPQACIVVEDSHYGIASAEAAGCQVVAVPSHTRVPPAPNRIVLTSLIHWTQVLGWP